MNTDYRDTNEAFIRDYPTVPKEVLGLGED